MKKLTFPQIAFCLSGLSLLLPWFSWNPGVMGYCIGFEFALYLGLPWLVLGVYVWSEPVGRAFGVIAEFCAVALVDIAVLAIGFWQVQRNMISHWRFSLAPVLPGYWISLALYLALFVAVQFKIFTRTK